VPGRLREGVVGDAGLAGDSTSDVCGRGGRSAQ